MTLVPNSENSLSENENIPSRNNEAIILPPLDFRIPNWDLGDLKERSCPICNKFNTISKYIRPDKLAVKLCLNCNLYFVSPAPSFQQITEFYAGYDINHRREIPITPQELLKQSQNIDVDFDLRIMQIKKILDIKNSKVLDIGFGRGQFLYILKKLGALTYGVELDKMALEYALCLGIDNIIEGTIDDIAKEEKFNIIVMNDLIEHPLDPIDLLNKANNLLAPNGIILFWTPNGEGMLNEPYPTTFRVDLEHMQYFTKETFRIVSQRLTLRIVHLETLGFPNLKNIGKPRMQRPDLKVRIKNSLKSIPGLILLNNLLKKTKIKFAKDYSEDKLIGSYHLFCIMQKNP